MRRLALPLAIFLAAATPANAQTLDSLFSFGGANGQYPTGGVVIDSAGDLLGTTSFGGPSNHGTIFRLSDNGAGGYSHTTLLNFSFGNGVRPLAGLTRGSAGNFFGTTSRGGAFGSGTVFRLSDDGAGGYTHTVLFSFSGGGTGPYAGVTLGPSGNLFGTTLTNGTALFNGSGFGTVFRLSDNGAGGYTHTTLLSFNGTNGEYPQGDLTLDAAGNLFGTTVFGGQHGEGTIFRLSDNGAGGYTHTTLFRLPEGTIGYRPYAGLTFDLAGNLLGTTGAGVIYNSGAVFRLSPDGAGGYTTTTNLLDFYGGNGQSPYGDLILDAVGNIFGTTRSGGAFDRGTIFRLSDNGAGGYTHTILYSFDTVTGAGPRGDLVADSAGNLYGTTERGGLSNFGTVFRLSNAGFVVASNEAPTSTPEPASLAILSLAVLSLAATHRRRSAAAA